MLIDVYENVPDDLFVNALEEINNINWESIKDPSRNSKVFSTSKAIHLRGHKTNISDSPKTLSEFSEIVECIDNLVIINFPNVMKLCHWILQKTHGIELGRVMIVNVVPDGNVGLHIDAGKYFDVYARFHIPMITNEDVVFLDNIGTIEHMPVQTLVRLNNKNLHGMKNNSATDRIHLICDIKLDYPNMPF